MKQTNNLISYLDVGIASELEGRDRKIYRLLEMLPGFLTWVTLIGLILLSWLAPTTAAFFIIIFDLYWLIKTVYLSFHLRSNWKKIRHNMNLDWEERLVNLKYGHLWQMVILPFYKEPFEVIDKTIEKILESKWNHKERTIVVLGYEERAGEESSKTAYDIQEKYKDNFKYFSAIGHPEGLKGEIPGKGSNIAFVASKAREEILNKNNIHYEDVLVSAFDIDTQVYPQYFFCLTWNFLTCEKPFRSSFQPVPLYNNNIWDAPAFSRVVAVSGTFWQMIQQERPERLATFSSHAINFKTLHEMGYWQKNIVSEDSRIFWKSLLYFDGDYSVVPLSYPVSLDANLAPTFWQTVKNVYRQQRRWTGGVENVPYILFGFLKNKNISFKQKFHYAFIQLEGFWSLATNSLIIFALGWLPLTLGGTAFNTTIISYNLPRMTRNIMNLAMTGLIMSSIISMSLLPPRPVHRKKWARLSMVLQWALIPFTIPLFGSIPGVDSQTRLMLAKYHGFWVTPKYRKKTTARE